MTYAPMAAHALMGEAVRRTDPQKRSYRQLVEDEILTRLKMKDTSVGVRADFAPATSSRSFSISRPSTT